MKSLIVSGGNIDRAFALDFLKKNTFEYVIGVDKGAEFCKEAQLTVDILAGDFDTIDPEVLYYYMGKNTPIKRFRPEKDDTDLEIALKIAKEQGASSITILGGTGTRLDHMIGTLYCMAGMEDFTECYLVDANNRVRILKSGRYVLKKSELYGPYVSLLPIGGNVCGVTLEGFKYPLEGATMTCYNSLGISNELVREEGSILLSEGVLACFETRD